MLDSAKISSLIATVVNGTCRFQIHWQVVVLVHVAKRNTIDNRFQKEIFLDIPYLTNLQILVLTFK